MSNNSSSKTGLFLMELIISLLFFSLAGAICIQLFVQSHMLSNKSVILKHSVLWAQNVAETFYGCNGDVRTMSELLENCVLDHETENQGSLTMIFDEDFHSVYLENETTSALSDSYKLLADITENGDLLNCNITIEDMQTMECIYSLNISLFRDKEVSYEQ